MAVSRLPDEATGAKLAEFLRHRGRSHSTTLIGMAAANLFLVGQLAIFLIDWPKQLQADRVYLIPMFGAFVLSHLLAAGVMIVAATAFRRARQYGLCFFATVLMMLPGCSVLFPFGILAGWPVLRFMLRPEVRLAFVLNSPDGDPDVG